MDLVERTQGVRPLRYVDVSDQELKDYPALAAAVAEGRKPPLVLVGGEVISPGTLSYYWVVDQLEALGVPGFVMAEAGKV